MQILLLFLYLNYGNPQAIFMYCWEGLFLLHIWLNFGYSLLGHNFYKIHFTKYVLNGLFIKLDILVLFILNFHYGSWFMACTLSWRGCILCDTYHLDQNINHFNAMRCTILKEIIWVHSKYWIYLSFQKFSDFIFL